MSQFQKKAYYDLQVGQCAALKKKDISMVSSALIELSSTCYYAIKGHTSITIYSQTLIYCIDSVEYQADNKICPDTFSEVGPKIVHQCAL